MRAERVELRTGTGSGLALAYVNARPDPVGLAIDLLFASAFIGGELLFLVLSVFICGCIVGLLGVLGGSIIVLVFLSVLCVLRGERFAVQATR
jgi:hypothetical protein